MFSYLVKALGTVSLVLMCSTIQPGRSDLQVVEQQREQWQTANVQHYVYQLRIDCFCPFNHVPVAIEVQNGVTIAVKDAATGELLMQNFFNSSSTIDRLFDEIQRETVTLDDRPGNHQVLPSQFDPLTVYQRTSKSATTPSSDADIAYKIETFRVHEWG